MTHRLRPPAPDLKNALEALPLFPLPQVVLMPDLMLPLHVFEPRYKQMVRDTLDSHGIIAVVQLREGATLPDGQPAICTLAGAGTIVDFAELAGGRFHILLRGLERVELDELPLELPYRRARGRVVPDTNSEVGSSELAGLISAATSFASLLKRRDPSFDFRSPRGSDPSSLVNHFAAHLLIDGKDRQHALETCDVAARVAFVTSALAMQRMGLAGPQGQLN